MRSKPKSIATLILMIALAAGLGLVSHFGVNEDGLFSYGNINLGLDLKGGINILYEADVPNPTSEEMAAARTLIQGRLDRRGYTDAEVAQAGANRIRVDIPGVADTEEAINTIGRTAQLMFVDQEGSILLTGMDVQTARLGTQAHEFTGISEPVVQLEFTSEGARLFDEATAANIGRPLYIVMDDTVLSAPVVNARISGGNAVITGNFTAPEAEELAADIRAGSLPFGLDVLSVHNVGARLGAESLERSVAAGFIGFGLTVIIMAVIYRVSGLAANLALCIFLGIKFFIISALGITLTLPGLAGIVLSVGVAVDGNIIIFERMKDELVNGRSLRASLEHGFSRAIPAIVDSSVTTIIAGVILFWLGTGPVMSFASTLVIGIVVSMFTAVVITKIIMKALIGLGIKDLRLYGLSSKPAAAEE
ncbi:MAG: protein translocase subunit SecD [Defluviitaleaceae bacterium]|nr:protein translocase subunit SecD [Defluviitaleaceae bacterium]